jgi:hypothetical protein
MTQTGANTGDVFSGRLLAVLIASAVVLLALSLYFMGAPESVTPGADAVGPSAFSRSALGHAGLADLLQRLGVPVTKSRYGSLGRLGKDGVLVIAEPLSTGDVLASLDGLARAQRVLLVLPKRWGSPSLTHPGWLADTQLLASPEVQLVLEALDVDGSVLRVDHAVSWTENRFAGAPSVAAPVQLMQSRAATALVASPQGMLLGEVRRGSRRLWILTDPDVLENHGLSVPGNAAFVMAVLDELRRGDGGVVFDETAHGYVSQAATPLKLLFTFPYVLATAQGLLAIGLLLWATMGRFGRPEPIPPELEPGKLGLIRNAAQFLGFAGEREVVLQRYAAGTLRDLGRRLHAPTGLDEGRLLDWLGRVGKARGVAANGVEAYRGLEQGLGSASRRAGSRKLAGLMELTREIYRWRRGIIDGDSRHPVDHGRDPRRDPQGGDRPG